MPHIFRCALLLLAAGMAAGCATSTFHSAPVDGAPFTNRTESRTGRGVTVTVSVPTAAEFEQLTGIDVYDDGIQPVWFDIENTRSEPVRVAYASVDPNYYSPLEVAWKYRRRFDDASAAELEAWFHGTKLPRAVPAGTRRSGFVYTHAVSGTKGFNVDLYWQGSSAPFTFFVTPPGFSPDYMSVDFYAMYDESAWVQTDREGLRELSQSFPERSLDAAGTVAGDPLNVLLVGSGESVLRALLRGGWSEQEAGATATRAAREHHYRGRPPDGVFHLYRPDGRERRELRLWLTPVSCDGLPVWIGQVNYEMSGRLFARYRDYRIDPDVDEARLFLQQNLWYSQALAAGALAWGMPSVPAEMPEPSLGGQEFFTDGRRVVLFISPDPVSLDDTEMLVWETYRGR